MEKKPVFLYVLLGLSALSVVLTIYSLVQLPSVLESFTSYLDNEQVAQQVGGVEVIRLQIAASKWTMTPLSLGMTALNFILFGTSAFFLFFKKDVVKATYAYLAMRVAALVSTMVSLMISNQLVRSMIKNRDLMNSLLSNNKYTALAFVAIFLILSAIAYFGLRRYQKSVEEAALDSEVF